MMITEIIKFLSKVVVTFILTNIQDIVILINFFLESSEEDSLLKNDHVVLGQLLGFSTLLMLSLLGYTISYILPVKLFGFLGFLIIFFGLIGLKKLIEDIRNKRQKKRASFQEIAENEKIEFIQLNTVKFLILFFTKNQIFDLLKEPIKSKENQSFCDDIKQIVKVSIVTIANGNDNIAIYVPIFVQSTSMEIIGYGLGFLFMVGVLCSTCYYFVHFPPIYKFAQKYAQYISPFIFIALGIYILIDSKCFPWLIEVIRTGKWTTQ